MFRKAFSLTHWYILYLIQHQRKNSWSGPHGSVGVHALCQSHQSHTGGGLLRAQCEFNTSHAILPSHHWFNFSSGSISLLFYTITLMLWPTVTIRWDRFIGYALAPGLQCNGRRCKNLSSCSMNLRTEYNSLCTDYMALQCDGWCSKNLSSRSFYQGAKCKSLFTNDTHHSK
jgi:hypothetical protein